MSNLLVVNVQQQMRRAEVGSPVWTRDPIHEWTDRSSPVSSSQSFFVIEANSPQSPILSNVQLAILKASLPVVFQVVYKDGRVLTLPVTRRFDIESEELVEIQIHNRNPIPVVVDYVATSTIPASSSLARSDDIDNEVGVEWGGAGPEW